MFGKWYGSTHVNVDTLIIKLLYFICSNSRGTDSQGESENLANVQGSTNIKLNLVLFFIKVTMDNVMLDGGRWYLVVN